VTTLRPRSTPELVELLKSGPGRVRIHGTGSRQHRLPEAGAAAPLLLAGLDAIERLDAPDQTCSVGAGLRREVLDAELARHGLELPLAGGGSIGGLFASDAVGAVTAGGPAPRTMLLGMEAVLADGTAFRSGARVVKSVAGFDVHKLLVGSRGRLFVATTLHLRLKPRPRAAVWFRRSGLDANEALRLFVQLRSLAAPPAALHLRTGAEGTTVRGRIAGRASFVAAMLRTHALEEGPPATELHLTAAPTGEVLTGIVAPSRALELLGMAPAGAPFLLHGGGRFECALPTAAASDALLVRLPAIGAHACIAEGPPARRGVGTPLDPGQQRLCDGLVKALDPHGILV
jgi:glycolate oxidase FAD binding subunit